MIQIEPELCLCDICAGPRLCWRGRSLTRPDPTNIQSYKGFPSSNSNNTRNSSWTDFKKVYSLQNTLDPSDFWHRYSWNQYKSSNIIIKLGTEFLTVQWEFKVGKSADRSETFHLWGGKTTLKQWFQQNWIIFQDRRQQDLP